VDTALSKSGFKKFISPVHDLHVQEILFCSTIHLTSKYCCTPQTEVSNHEQCVWSSSARTTKSNNRPTRWSFPATAFTQQVQTAASTARETPGRHNPWISSATVRRRLCENGLHARRPFRGPLITPRHRQQRLAWARTHLQWTRQRWQEVLFSDESCFCISNADGRIKVWRRQNERLAWKNNVLNNSLGHIVPLL
jgi:hypothetical protein